MTERAVLVVGASGLIGRAAVDAFVRAGWDVVATSRRRPDDLPSGVAHIALDLTDPESTSEALLGLRDVTHLVYAAAHEQASLVAGWSDPEQMQTNRSMLANVLTPLSADGRLEHVSLMQGTKAYGVHLHPIPLPARERHPRDPHPNFYWLQEDLLVELARSRGFDWTILRPVQVVGPSFGVAYCTPPVIGALAAVCHREGRDFHFPGGAGSSVKQAVDVRLVADALVWAATAPGARGEHFNLTNGEVFGWQELWPLFGDVMGVEVAPPRPLSLAEFLPTMADTWSAIVREHDLRPLTLLQLLGSSHQYADYTFGFGLATTPPPALVSSIKIKQAGFAQVRDTEDTFRHALETLIDRRVLPPPSRRSRSGTASARSAT